jgi:putative cell wall-binding protein
VILLAAVLALVPGPRAAEAGGYTWISVDVSSQTVSGDGWTPYVPVTLTLSHPQTPARTATITTPVGSQMSFSARVTPVFLVRPGDTIVATNGSTTKTLVVGPIALIGSNAATDSIWGTALPGETIRTRIVGTSKTASSVVPATGRWGVFYSGIYDLVVGTPVDFRELDDDWDATVISATLPANGDVDYDTILNTDDNCQWDANITQYDGDGDGAGTRCDDVDRMWGANRYGTAAAVSAAAFEEADEAFIALGTNFPDALVAAAAGGHMDAPVLLTGSDSLPAGTIAELIRLSPQTVYVVGGTAVISPAVEAALAAYAPHVIRLAGADRYATSAAVSGAAFPAATAAFVALGTNFPDALVAAAAAGHLHDPVLLTRPDHVPQATLDELTRLHPSEIYIIGGTAAISTTVAHELAPYAPTVTRIAGSDRYATAAAVADEIFSCFARPLLAYGRNFPDALVAAAAGGHLDRPVLLVERDTIPDATMQALTGPGVLSPGAWIVGGTAVISDAVFNAVP